MKNIALGYYLQYYLKTSQSFGGLVDKEVNSYPGGQGSIPCLGGQSFGQISKISKLSGPATPIPQESSRILIFHSNKHEK